MQTLFTNQQRVAELQAEIAAAAPDTLRELRAIAAGQAVGWQGIHNALKGTPAGSEAGLVSGSLVAFVNACDAAIRATPEYQAALAISQIRPEEERVVYVAPDDVT